MDWSSDVCSSDLPPSPSRSSPERQSRLLLRPAFSLKGKEDIMGRITDNRADIYQEITDQMIAMIEAGTRPWSKSWNGSTAPNIPPRSTGVPYRGINVLRPEEHTSELQSLMPISYAVLRLKKKIIRLQPISSPLY